MAVESLLTLRKKANELGIQNYAKYSKEELAKLIEQKEAGVETYTDPEYIASDEDAAKEEEMVKEHEESVQENAEEPRPEDEKNRKEAKKKEKKEKKEKAPKKEKKPVKEKKEKAPKVVLNVKPKSETKPEGLKNLSSQVYDELLKNDGRSFYQIAKTLSTYYTVVKHVCDKYFDVVSE
jgi:hypothetical protein|uniref:Uncharacterized protein n=1 Tax=Siphoviridae sp. ct3r22 TaxID=2825325 RepID=A0A8S5V199_9CAUD|nr:MAG TPA: hypothetical protein [Siphoviridae sp. ct3r22]